MTSGISFEFNFLVDLQFAEAFFDAAFPSKFSAGQIAVLCGDEVLGAAGKLSDEIIESLESGTELRLVADLDEEQSALLESEVNITNKAIDWRYKTFGFVSELNRR